MPDRFDVLDDDFNDAFDPYGPKPRRLTSSPLRRMANRRAVLAGLGAVLAGAVAAGAAGMRGLFGQGDPTPSAAPTAVNPTATRAPQVVTTSPVSAQVATPTAVAATPVPAATAALMADGVVPPGMALVTSPRLPLFGIGAGQVGPLLAGEIADWRALGAAAGTAVTPLALAGLMPAGMRPAETFADYAALVAGLENQRGGVALVPLEEVDFRVNVLAIDGFDPLRDQVNPTAPLIRIAVVGDIVPGRNVERKMRAFNDYTRPFAKIAPELSGYDLTIANLEGNLSADIPPPEDPNTFSFIADPAMIEGLRLGGIDAVTVANNHSVFNSAGWGVEAFIDTIEALEAASFPYFGGGRDLEAARQPFVATVKDRTIAWLGIDGVTGNAEQTAGVVTFESGAGASSPGTNPFVTDQFLADIADAAGQYNIVIPYFHMGVEYLGVPPSWAIAAAHGAIDAGATMVVTNHPHVIQGMEIYGGKPIIYSVGNFVFDQMFSVDTRQGLILEITVQGSRVVGIRTRGIEIEDFHQPRLMSGGEQAAIMDRFWRSTDRTAAGVAF